MQNKTNISPFDTMLSPLSPLSPHVCFFQYDFVVKTVGACTVRPNICLVQEKANLSLFELLHGRDERASISDGEKAAMLYDVARGLQFLHIKRIIHGNLKSTNVLVFDNNRLK